MIVRCPLDGAMVTMLKAGDEYCGTCGCGFRIVGTPPPLKIGDKTWHPETRDWR